MLLHMVHINTTPGAVASIRHAGHDTGLISWSIPMGWVSPAPSILVIVCTSIIAATNSFKRPEGCILWVKLFVQTKSSACSGCLLYWQGFVVLKYISSSAWLAAHQLYCVTTICYCCPAQTTWLAMQLSSQAAVLTQSISPSLQKKWLRAQGTSFVQEADAQLLITRLWLCCCHSFQTCWHMQMQDTAYAAMQRAVLCNAGCLMSAFASNTPAIPIIDYY